ncbi:MAG: tetratricopeptide repeat protein [Selenomonadaceae bacterium]|nr:tetratricopeptide repeat protein [Selenomonadaceae bacterium]
MFKPARLFVALVVMLSMLIALPTMSDAASKIKFDKKKLRAAQVIDAPALDIPMMMQLQAPERVTILGDPTVTQAQMVALINKRNPKPLLNCSVQEIVQLYYEEAGREGIRPDVALCQALKETAFFAYGGDVDPKQNNYCGLGATGNHEPGNSFDSPRMGVRAHIQHLLAYTTKREPRTILVDPRYNLVKNLRKDIFGKLTHWTDLNGTWAVPGTYYGQELLRIWQQAKIPDNSPATFLAANRNLQMSAPTAEMFVFRGLIYYDREDYYNAQADFDSAVVLEPDSVEALYDLALTLEKLNLKDEAIEAYDRLLAIDDKFFNGWYNRGRLKLLKGDYVKAIEDFNQALVVEPISANVVNEIGVAHFRQGKYEEAYADFERAYDLNDRNEIVIDNRNLINACIKKKKK